MQHIDRRSNRALKTLTLGFYNDEKAPETQYLMTHHPPKFIKNVKKIGGKMPRGNFQGWVRVLIFFLAVENHQPDVRFVLCLKKN